MEAVRTFLNQLITISDREFEEFMSMSYQKKVKRNEILSASAKIPHEGFFILNGIVRLFIVDNKGNEKTIHFAFENQISGDYENLINKKPSILTIQAVKETEVLVFPSSAIEWGLANLQEGQKLGRLLAEYHFFLFQNRINDLYLRTPKERYDNLTTIFPDIHNKVPQHMIASYLGITPIHLCRLKKADRKT